MNYLSKMYGRSNKPAAESLSSDKNPNRVAGGIKGQGGDHYTLLGEDGQEKSIPTHKYVQSLESQIRTHNSAMTVMERKMYRMTRSIEQLENAVQRISRPT